MTTKDKRLLLRDLCARLPDKTYIEIVDEGGNIYDEVELEPQHINTVRYDQSTTIRPYLRSMSSMTKKEEKEYYDLTHQDNDDIWGKCLFDKMVDFCNQRHLDYRGLIEKGLALEAPEGMYK